MDDITGVAQALGFAAQTVGLAVIAVRTGSWKGTTDSKIKDLEKNVNDVRVKVESMDDRLDGVEKEFSKALARIETNLDFIKESLVELKAKG